VLVSATVAVEPALWLLRSFRAMKCFLVVKAGFTKGGHWVAYFLFFFSAEERYIF
jgi:hypothetical protein